MTDISYREIARQIKDETMGAELEQVVNAARLSVIESCKVTDILNDKTAWDWNDAAEFTIPHPSFNFARLLGVWANKEDPRSRLDDSLILDVAIGEGQTLLKMRDLTGIRRLVARWSFSPLMGSDSFPGLIWEQFPLLIKYGALKEMFSYQRPNFGHMGRTPPNFLALWHNEVRNARARINPMPGPESVQPFAAGLGDWYGTGPEIFDGAY